MSRVITCDADIAEGTAWLCQNAPGFARLAAATGPFPLRLRGDGFEALLNAIVSQQVSVASANAIQLRLETAGITSATTVLEAGEEGLRAAGLSRPKIRYALALAEADLDYPALRNVPDGEVIETLTAVTGIGVWTAQIYAMFSLGRADVFAPGDLALQEASKLLFDLPERPNAKELAARAQAWSPWRAVAARGLFAYYRVAKQREGLS